MKNAWIFVLWVIVFAVVLGVPYVQRTREAKKLESYIADLSPQLEVARLALKSYQSTNAPFRSPRPYAVVHVGDTFHRFPRLIYPNASTTVPDAFEVKTLILLAEEFIQSATYNVQTYDKGSMQIGQGQANFERYRFYLWAIDIASGRVSAYTVLQDGKFEYDSQGHGVSVEDVIKWADSVTTWKRER